MASAWSGRGWLALLTAAAVLIGTVLRFAYIGQDYTHPDEAIALHVVPHLVEHRDFDTNWIHSGFHSRFVFDGTPLSKDRRSTEPQYNFSSYYLTLGLCESLRGLLLAPSGAPDVFWYRLYSGIFGTAALVIAVLLAARIQGALLALCVALWMSANPLLVQDCHYGRPESFLTLLTVTLVWVCESRRLDPRARAGLAGLLFGFAVACKISFALWFWLPFLACCGDADVRAVPPRRELLHRAGLVALASLCGFFLGVPRALADMKGFLTGVANLQYQYSHRMGTFSHPAGGAVYDYFAQYAVETLGWGVLVLFALGLASAAWARSGRELLLIFAPVISLLALSGAQQVFFERNLSHAIPLFVIGAGLGLTRLASIRGAPRYWGWIAAAAAACVACVPAATSERLVSEGFSGRYGEGQLESVQDFLHTLNRSVAESIVGCSMDPPFDEFRTRFRGRGPFLVLWHDFNSDFTRSSLDAIGSEFYASELASFPGLFGDYRSPSSLKNYLFPTQRVVLIYGIRDKSLVVAPQPPLY